MSDHDEFKQLLEVVEEEQAARLETRIERRRESFREVLFFLEMVRPLRAARWARWLGAGRAVANYCPFALRQAVALLEGGLEASRDDRLIGEMAKGAREGLKKSPAPVASRPGARVGAEAVAQLERIQRVIGWWNTLRSSKAFGEEREMRAVLEGDHPDAEAIRLPDCMSKAAWLRRRVYEFLELTERGEPSPPRRLLRFRLPDLGRFLVKNLTLLWVLPVVAFVALRVEAVNSLLRNDPGFTWLAVALAALPLLVTRARILALRWSVDSESGEVGAEQPDWDLGGRAFRSLRWAAVGPAATLRRWPRGRELLDKLTRLAAERERQGAPAKPEEGDGSRELAYSFLTLSAQGRPGILRAIHLAQLFSLLAYAAWWVACGLVVQAVTDPAQPFLTSYVILVLLSALIFFAHQIDFLDFLYPQRVRLRLLLAGLGVGLLVLLAKEELFPWFFLAIAVYSLVRWGLDRGRYLELILGGICLPIAVLTGIKDRTNAEEVWLEPDSPGVERLAVLDAERAGECRETPDWPYRPPGLDERPEAAGGEPVVILAASGGGSRAALYTGLTLRRLHREFPAVAGRLQAISSVSGGSLASAAYTVRRLEAAGGEALEWRLDEMVDALRGDFLRPTLKGATVQIGTSRGQAIEEHWQDGKVGLGEWTVGQLADEWRKLQRARPATPRFPIPLFNTSTLDSHDVVISPLARSFYTRDDLPAAVELAEDATWVYDRDGIYGLDDLLPGYDPGLAKAVRASANFPFGFPLVRVSTTEPLAFSPLARERQRGPRKTVYLTDGGALSNSGLWPLFNLLAHRCLVDRLRQRGVLLIVVDASKMPTYPVTQKKYGTLWSAIGDQAPIAQALHRRGYDALEALYGERLAVLQVNLLADLRHNVLTTWALSNHSFETLRGSFDSRWREQRVQLCGKWRALTGGYPNADCGEWRAAAVDAALGGLIDRQRPPLD